MVGAYHRRLSGPARPEQLEAARAWTLWEDRTTTLLPSHDGGQIHTSDHRALAFARIENHFFVNAGFMEEGQLILDAHKLRGIPGTIVQGRYDMCTPVRTAWELHRAWPEADFQLVKDAGHAFNQPGTLAKLIEATDRYASAGVHAA
jgi:proline iminopeptidase